MKSKFNRIVKILICLLCIISISFINIENISAATVKLNYSSITLETGASKSLKVTGQQVR